jgi:hypothetical protein
MQPDAPADHGAMRGGGPDGPNPVMEREGRRIRALLESPRFCHWVGSAAPEILGVLAGEGRIGKKLARAIGRQIRSGCHARAQMAAQKESNRLNEDAALWVEVTADVLNQSLAALSALQEREKKALLVRWVQRLDTAGLGRILTGVLQMAQNSGNNSDLLRDKLTAFLEATDFGELPDAAADARERWLPLWEEALAVVWSYPSKVVSLLATLPPLVELAADAAARGLAPFNQLPPDMLVDVIVSLIHDLDGRAVGELVNQGTELVRKIQVGSTLIGDSGRPALPRAVDRLMEAALDAVDLEALARARQSGSLLADAMAEKRVERQEQLPEWSIARLTADLTVFSRQARAFSRQVRCWESLSDEELTQAVADGLSDLDAGELAETCNRCLDLAGRVMEARPDFMPHLVGAFAEEIDMDAIVHCLASASPSQETGNRFADLAAPLIHSLADGVEADPDSELASALRRLGGIMCGS